MVTRRDLIKLGVVAATSAGCGQVARASGALPADVDSAPLTDQQAREPKVSGANQQNSWRPYVEIIGADPYPGPSVTVVNPIFRSPIRGFESLDGEWDFALDPETIGFEQGWFKGSGPFNRKIQVPGVWSTQGVGEPGMSHPTHIEGYSVPLRNQYTGSGWYKKVLTRRPEWNGKQVWLKVGGVNSRAWFWLNGKYIGQLYRSCGAYKFDLTTRIVDGENTFVIWVSNQEPSRKGLLNWIDQFGGFYRSIELETTSAVYLDDVWAQPEVANRRANFVVKLLAAPEPPCKFEGSDLIACSTKPIAGNYRVRIAVTTLPDGKEAGKAQVDLTEIAQTGTEISVPVSLDPFRPWSPEEPALYRADLVLERDGQSIDGWTERFGVRSIERHGPDLLLNGKKIFLVGFGDDYVYPLTVASPPSRGEHLVHLKIARSYGFNYVRLHTHIETPEYFEAAEDAGIMIQPAIPYEGSRPAVRDGSYSPLDDLDELICNYRRYVSPISYCMGNEGFHHPDTRVALYRFSKMMDPTRMVRAQDGVGTDYEGISDIHGGPIGEEPLRQEEIVQTMPVVLHEYLNLSAPPDYRLAPLFKGAEAPPYDQVFDRRGSDPNLPSSLFVRTEPKLLAGSDVNGATDLGISPALAERVIEGGHELQSIYQKIGLEQARSLKGVTGYNYWTIVDIDALRPQGLLNTFWGPKRSTPEYFRQFNSPVVLLLPDLSPYGTDRVLNSGARRSYRVACSNFGSVELAGETISWKLVLNGNTLSQGRLEKVHIPQGAITDLGTIDLTMPNVSRPAEVFLHVQFEGEKAHNSWQFYCFPENWARVRPGRPLATSAIHSLIAKQYPETKLLSPEMRPDSRDLLFTDRLNEPALKFIEGGGIVLLLSLTDFSPLQPGIRVGWWTANDQRGTAMAASKAFGDFPSKDGVPSFAMFGLIHDAVLLQGQLVNRIEPLMVTLSKLGYSLSVFETRIGSGRLFATGLDLLSGGPEASYLLDQFVSYCGSHDFSPRKSMTLSDLRARIKFMA
jgi:beta-galactosidase